MQFSNRIFTTFYFIIRVFFILIVIYICIHSYLALVAGLASEADYIFIPESPAPPNWPEKICDKILQVLYSYWIGAINHHQLPPRID